MYMYMYVYMYMYIYMYVCIYIYIYIHIDLLIYLFYPNRHDQASCESSRAGMKASTLYTWMHALARERPPRLPEASRTGRAPDPRSKNLEVRRVDTSRFS